MIKNTNIIIGPPGTGKTAKLMDIMEAEFKNGCQPDKMLFCSFTKKAVEEAINRASDRFNFTKKEMIYFKTIHSLAFNSLGLKRDQVLSHIDYNKIGKHLGLVFSSQRDPSQEMSFGKTNGDYYQFITSFSYAKGITDKEAWDLNEHVDANWFEYVRFKDTVNEYKKMFGKVDFHDMILNCENPIDVDVAIIDEAQDLSHAQWQFIMKFLSKAKKIYIAGDDDQSIFAWSGADINTFTGIKGKKEILHQSHRIPQSVYKIASEITSKIKHRTDKKYKPTSDVGSVNYWNSVEHVDMTSGSWLLLARNSYLLDELALVMRHKGINYSYRDRIATGGNDIKAIKYWEKMRKGKILSEQEKQVVSEFLPQNKPWPVDKIWYEALVLMNSEDKEYYISLLRRGESLTSNPRVNINTIHGVKGGEADNVILLTDMSYSTWNASTINPDAEHRVWYVGVTRTKKNLHIIMPRGRYNYNI